MLIDVAVVAVVAGWIFRGSLASLAELEVRRLLLVLLCAAMQYGGQYAAGAGWISLDGWGALVYSGILVLLLSVLWRNRRHPALLLMTLGICLNFLVAATNGGPMPVSVEGLIRAGLSGYVQPLAAGEVATHQLLNDHTRFPFLAEIFVLPEPYPRASVFSLGDAVLAAGAFWLIVGGMTAHPSVTGKRRALEVRRLTFGP